MKDTLYNITGDLSVIIDEVIENGGELSEELEKQLDGSKMAFDKKGENVVKYVLNLDGDIEAIDVEIKRLQARKKARVNAKERLKDYLHMNMLRVDILKIECPTFTATVTKNPASVEIVDEKAIPETYTEERTTVYIDKTAIKVALKAKKEVPGAKLITDKTSLRIR